jgi:hypothetical protein
MQKPKNCDLSSRNCFLREKIKCVLFFQLFDNNYSMKEKNSALFSLKNGKIWNLMPKKSSSDEQQHWYSL